MSQMKKTSEPVADFSPAQEEAPFRVAAGASKTLTWNAILKRLQELDARLAALEK